MHTLLIHDFYLAQSPLKKYKTCANGQKVFYCFQHNLDLCDNACAPFNGFGGSTQPYGYLWEVLFATVLAASWLLAFKYPSFGKRWILLLFVVGVAEMEFSSNTHGYNSLVAGLIIGLVTAYSGFIIPALCLAKLHFRKKQVKILFILSGCLELILGAVGILTAFNFGLDPFIMYFGLLTIGFYSLIVGIASLLAHATKKESVNKRDE